MCCPLWTSSSSAFFFFFLFFRFAFFFFHFSTFISTYYLVYGYTVFHMSTDTINIWPSPWKKWLSKLLSLGEEARFTPKEPGYVIRVDLTHYQELLKSFFFACAVNSKLYHSLFHLDVYRAVQISITNASWTICFVSLGLCDLRQIFLICPVPDFYFWLGRVT